MRRKLIAVLAAAGLLFQTFPNSAEAGSFVSKLAALSAEIVLVIADYEVNITKRTPIWKTENQTHTSADKRLMFDTAAYGVDHIGMLSRNEVWTDDTTALLFDLVLSGDRGLQLSFRTTSGFTRGAFDAKNPAYSDLAPLRSSPWTNYPDAYRERVKELKSYAKNVLTGNNVEMQALRASQSELDRVRDSLFGYEILSSLNLSSIINVIGPGKLGVIEQLMETAGVRMEIPVIPGTNSVAGNRMVLQAVNQAANYNNKTISQLRVDIMRQLEAETQLALYDRQERSGRQAAFEGATKWTDPTYTPSGY